MYLLVVLNLLMLFVSIMVMFLASLLSKKTNLDYEKNSPFECGFDPKTSSRLSFSLSFFLIAIIFLIFDIEIALLLPMIYIMKTSNLMNFSFTLMFFIFILILGLYYEWNQGSLNWSN